MRIKELLGFLHSKDRASAVESIDDSQLLKETVSHLVGIVHEHGFYIESEEEDSRQVTIGIFSRVAIRTTADILCEVKLSRSHSIAQEGETIQLFVDSVEANGPDLWMNIRSPDRPINLGSDDNDWKLRIKRLVGHKPVDLKSGEQTLLLTELLGATVDKKITSERFQDRLDYSNSPGRGLTPHWIKGQINVLEASVT